MNYEERKELNRPFLTAFEWKRKQMKMTQGDFAALVGISGSRLSEYKSGKSVVNEVAKNKLAIAFGGELYPPYLDGKCPYMLVSNVPDDFVLNDMEYDNPDYKLLQELRKEKRIATLNNEGTSNIIDLYATLIKELEAMRRDLASELEQVRQLKYELTNEREAIHSIVQQLSTVLSHSRAQYSIDEGDRYRVAADQTN